MRYEEAVAAHEPLDEFEQGLVRGLELHSWMRDGTTYVGNGQFTLGDAIDRAITDRRAGDPALRGVGGS